MKPIRLLALLALALAACRDDATSPEAPAPAEPPAEPRAAATPAWAEARALWVNRFEYDSPTKIATIMQKAADANFNLVYFQVRGSGDAYYKSSLEPCSVGLCGKLGGTPSWDPLEVAVAEAHARGLQLHAWLNALTGWGSGSSTTCSYLTESDPGNPRHMLLEHPEWKVVDNAGTPHPCPNNEEYVYVSPGVAGVRTHTARVAADIARRYAVDGIHLDRIRLPGTKWSYDTESLNAFGKDPAAYPAEWSDFRRGLVNKTVKEAYDSVMAVKSTLALSAAIWPIYVDKWGWNSSQGYHQYFQDPYAWAKNAYLDVAAPMTYYTIDAAYCDHADWACLLDDHLQRIQGSGARHVYIGIGAKNGATEVERQVKLARQQGAMGVSLYSYNSVESNGLWTVLKGGVFAQKASLPPLDWKSDCCSIIVVDNNNANNNTSVAYAEASSNWTTSKSTSGYYGTDYQYASTKAVSDPATFWFYAPAAVTKTVDAWWTAGSNRSDKAPYIVYDADGTKLATVYVNQQTNGGKWNQLGTWSFKKGWNRVQLSRWTTTGYVVIADAVRVR
jgi:uncharacterized lipoprotein YddW (UPF0748 family)